MLDMLGQQLPRFLLSFNVCTVPCAGTGKPQSDLLYLSKQWLPLGTQRKSSETLEKARKVYLVVHDASEPNTGTLVTEEFCVDAQHLTGFSEERPCRYG